MKSKTKLKEKETHFKDEDSEYDMLTSIIGVFGRFQLILSILMGFCNITLTLSGLGTKFLTSDVDYWCERPEHLSNLSTSAWLNLSAPLLADSLAFDRCNIFDVDFLTSVDRPDPDTPTIPCTKWEFAQEPFQNTIMQRWSLVCSNDEFGAKPLSQSIFFAGATVGSLLGGFLSDWYGRLTTFVFSVGLHSILIISTALIDNPYYWIFTRFFIGIAFLGTSNAKVVYTAELTSGSWRAKIHHWFGDLFWQIGYLITGLAVFLIPDMKMFELFVALTGLPFVFLWFILPESPRWLISQGRFKEAKKVMSLACRMNGLPEENVDKIATNVENFKSPPRGFVTDLLKLPGTRRNLLCMTSSWFSISMGYYGLVFNTPSFDWNLYLVFVLPALLAIPLAIGQPFFVNKLGRKYFLSGSMMLAGTLLMLTMAVPDGMFSHNWPVIVCCWLGTVSCQAAFNAGYVYTKDLFPTSHRGTALSTVSASARIGSLVSPFVNLLKSVNPVLPLVTYGSCLIISAIVSCFIYPDTSNTKMPETLMECEMQSTTRFCCRPSRRNENLTDEAELQKFVK